MTRLIKVFRNIFLSFSLIILIFYILITSTWRLDFTNNEIEPYIKEIKQAENLPNLFYELYNIDTNYSLESGAFKYLTNSLYSSNSNPPVSIWISRMMFIPKRNNRILPKILNLELSLATKIEKETSSKQQLIFMLKRADFVNGQIGVKNAANFYFKKELNELNKEEIATLVVMTRNPSLYNPARRPEKIQIEVENLLS
ncbi:MAG: transglycosylase domain-containing protein, partial [Flavobacterium sp.]|nr:transglycosylase domain-containing protein [Flavobacterium sp.]